jgi:hypothetical protein
MSQAEKGEVRMNRPAPVPTGQRERFSMVVGLVLLSIGIRLPFLATPGFLPDQTQFLHWSLVARDDGLAAVYRPRPSDGRPLCNYPPLYVYALRGLAVVFDRAAPAGAGLDRERVMQFAAGLDNPATRAAAAIYKLPAILADAAASAVLFLVLARRLHRRAALAIGLLYAILPPAIHNSALWGQIDALPAMLILLSLESARRRRPVWMCLMAGLAVLTKAQAAVFAPIWLSAMFRDARQDARGALAGAIVLVVTLILVLLPFLGVWPGVWQAWAGAAGYYPYTHLNGFSVWFTGRPLLEPHLLENLAQWYRRDDLPAGLGMTPRAWAACGLACLGLWILVDLLRHSAGEASILRAARLLPLGFFLLSTQMHERYLFPAIAAWAWAAVPTARWWISWLGVSLVATVNAMWVWPGPAEAWWTAPALDALRRPWIGLAPGVWCCAALLAILAAEWLARDARRPPAGERATAAGG